MNSETVKEHGTNEGASVVGIASTDDFGSAPEGSKPSDKLNGCRSVIVLAAPFTQVALNDPAEYTEVRQKMVKRMGDIAEKVAKQIKSNGHKAVPIVSLSEKISLRHAAELAGLGVIGRNHLLISREYGNLLWFSAVLTDAELIPDKKAEYSFCDDCDICVKACPVNALDDPVSFGRKECSAICMKMVKGAFTITCFQCRKVCPHRFGK